MLCSLKTFKDSLLLKITVIICDEESNISLSSSKDNVKLRFSFVSNYYFPHNFIKLLLKFWKNVEMLFYDYYS